MATRNSTEEVMEKRDYNPVTVSCLVVACLALMGAIGLEIAELVEYRRAAAYARNSDDPDPVGRQVNADIATLKRLAQSALDGTAADGEDPEDEDTDGEDPDAEDELDTDDVDVDADDVDVDADDADVDADDVDVDADAEDEESEDEDDDIDVGDLDDV